MSTGRERRVRASRLRRLRPRSARGSSYVGAARRMRLRRTRRSMHPRRPRVAARVGLHSLQIERHHWRRDDLYAPRRWRRTSVEGWLDPASPDTRHSALTTSSDRDRDRELVKQIKPIRHRQTDQSGPASGTTRAIGLAISPARPRSPLPVIRLRIAATACVRRRASRVEAASSGSGHRCCGPHRRVPVGPPPRPGRRRDASPADPPARRRGSHVPSRAPAGNAMSSSSSGIVIATPTPPARAARCPRSPSSRCRNR